MRKGNVVYKYDLKGNFLCSYLNTSQAARDISCDESTIRKAANENKKCKGFIWSRTKTEEFAKYYQGFGYNKQSANECVLVELGCMETKKSGGWNCLVDKNAPNVISAFLESERNKNILIIGDLHAPFIREGYLEFCQKIYYKHNCTDVIFIGDILDNHFSSFHDTDADGHSAKEELRLAKLQIKEWYKAFPNAKVCLGNHDLIPQRKMFNAGVSKVWLKNIGDILDTPGWEYAEEFLIDDILYVHGTGRKADIRMQQDLISTVQGHYHSESYIKYSVGKRSKLFAMQIGCGVDDKSYAMAYGKYFAKNHINCGVVLENGKLPVIEYMDLNK